MSMSICRHVHMSASIFDLLLNVLNVFRRLSSQLLGFGSFAKLRIKYEKPDA